MRTKRDSKYTIEKLGPVVEQSRGYSDVLRRLGLKLCGGNQAFIRKHIKRLCLDTSHFSGQAWLRNQTCENSEHVRRQTMFIAYDPEQVLTSGSLVSGVCVRRALLKTGRAYICENGHPPEWMGHPLTLHLDHKDGDRLNNHPDNLRFLCPNCHQQTPTWGSKRRQPKIIRDRKDVARERYIERYRHLVPIVINSGIDFSKLGWVTEVAPLINQRPQHVRQWMKKLMPDFLATCYSREDGASAETRTRTSEDKGI